MEASIACCEHVDNKENIPPISVKEMNPVLQECKLSREVKKRKFRRPLRDITNLFVFGQQAHLTNAPFPGFGLHSIPSAISSCKKRKLADDDIDWRQQNQNACVKILRKEFR